MPRPILASALLVAAAAPAAVRPVETLTSIAALPPHLAGAIGEMSACEQATGGQYFVFDRRSHTVYTVPPSRDDVRRLIQIGAEKGRVLRPTAFDLAGDGTFAVADAPGGYGRVQVFHLSGASLGGFTLRQRDAPMVVIDGHVLNGVGSLEYTGSAVFISQPENGALVTEYGPGDGRVRRSFGALRRTGHEDDPDVHLALNAGLVLANPKGGFYYVFVAGTPAFRKYDDAGTQLFERHVEGLELDEYVRTLPATWPRQRGPQGELPLVRPAIRAAAVHPSGDLWIALAEAVTYVYDADGDKRRAVQFRGAGLLAPRALSFTPRGQLVVTPGCYLFDVG
jgi:hypothetical protein